MSWPLWQTEVPHPPHCPLLWTQLVAGLVVKCVKFFFHCVLSMGKLENENVMGEENINLPGIQFRSSGQGVFSAAWKTISSQVLHWSSCTRWVILQTSPCLQTWIVSQIVSRGNVCSPLPCKHCFLNQSKVWRIGCTRKGLCVCVCVRWVGLTSQCEEVRLSLMPCKSPLFVHGIYLVRGLSAAPAFSLLTLGFLILGDCHTFSVPQLSRSNGETTPKPLGSFKYIGPFLCCLVSQYYIGSHSGIFCCAVWFPKCLQSDEICVEKTSFTRANGLLSSPV